MSNVHKQNNEQLPAKALILQAYHLLSSGNEYLSYPLCREMLQSFTEDQLDRFEAHKRSSLNKKNMKRVRVNYVQSETGLQQNPPSGP